MKHEELTNLLKQLSAEGLGPIPKEVYGIIGNNIDFAIIDELETEEFQEEEDPVKQAMKKDPLFGSW